MAWVALGAGPSNRAQKAGGGFSIGARSTLAKGRHRSCRPASHSSGSGTSACAATVRSLPADERTAERMKKEQMLVMGRLMGVDAVGRESCYPGTGSGPAPPLRVLRP